MLITPVQSKILAVGTSSAPALAFNANTNSGNTIIAIVSWASSTGSVTNVRDNINGAINYTLAKLVQGNGKSVGIFFLPGIIGGTTPTVTATLSGSQSFTALSIYEFSGLSGTVDVTGSNTSGTATTSPTSGPINTLNSNDLIIGAVLGGTPSAGEGGWTALLSSTQSSEFLIPGIIGTYTATWTTASNAYAAAIASFMAAPDPVPPYNWAYPFGGAGSADILTTDGFETQYQINK